jgi:hypothetical protein
MDGNGCFVSDVIEIVGLFIEKLEPATPCESS